MLRNYKSFTCPVCHNPLGSFNPKELNIVTCRDSDCKIKWVFKPNEAVPTALDYPGKKESKVCKCPSCKGRE